MQSPLRILVLACCLWSTGVSDLKAQLYLDDIFSNGNIVPLNLCDCSTGNPISSVQSGASAASASLVYSVSDGQIVSINPNNGQLTIIAPFPYGTNGLVLGTNGLLYSVGQTADSSYLFSINPSSGVVTELGGLPSDFGLQGDLFFYNGTLYALAISGTSSVIAEIPLGNPYDIEVLHDYAADFVYLYGGMTLTLNGTLTVVVFGEEIGTGDLGLYTIDMSTGAYTPLCPDLIAGDLAAAPNTVVDTCCNADAGTFSSLAAQTLCENAVATVNHNGDETLPNGYELYYLLVVDPTPEFPADVLMVSSDPSFAFDPAVLDVNTTYFIVALSAPSGPDFGAECLDISAAVPVTWKPLPSVNLAAIPPDLCTTGCVTLELVFAGSAPITVDWSVPTQNGTLGGSWTASPGVASFTVCAPPGDTFVPGEVTLQLLSISDAFCSCTW